MAEGPPEGFEFIAPSTKHVRARPTKVREPRDDYGHHDAEFGCARPSTLARDYRKLLGDLDKAEARAAAAEAEIERLRTEHDRLRQALVQARHDLGDAPYHFEKRSSYDHLKASRARIEVALGQSGTIGRKDAAPDG